MVVVTVVVYPLDEHEEEGRGQTRGGGGGVDGLRSGRGCAGSSFQDLLFCHQTLPRPLITN